MAAFDPNTIELDPLAFRAWLEQAGENIVGRACLAGSCPIAHWLGSCYGRAFSVTPYSILVKGDTSYVPLPVPEWVALFVSAADERMRMVWGLPITGREALAVFDGLFAGSPESE